MRAAGAAGLLGLMVPREHGGAGLSLSGFCQAVEVLAHADMGFAFALVPHNNLASAIAQSDRARERYLPSLLDGSLHGAFLLTEPQAGTHAAQIATTATPDGDGWRLNGEKAWVTGAAEADMLRVHAQTDAAAGSRGIAAFLVHAEQPGVVRGEPYRMLGGHATGAGGFRLEDVAVGPEQLFSRPARPSATPWRPSRSPVCF